MSDFNTFTSIAAEVTDSAILVQEADHVLARFTRAFNYCDIEGMDAELQFSLVKYPGSELLIWQYLGKHPENFFESLKKTGWGNTKYEDIKPVHISINKVHS